MELHDVELLHLAAARRDLATGSMSPLAARRAVIVIIFATALVRFWLAASTGLGIDESYMVTNAREFALGYVDHPPLHVWIAGLAQIVFQSDAPIFVRAPFILLFAGSTWLMYRLTERLFGSAAAVWAVVTLNIVPVFSLADATWVLPDGPLIFFLLAAANTLARVLFDDTAPAHPALWWTAAGVLGGLALLSKYTAVLFFAAVFLFLLSTNAGRRWLRTPGPWFGVLAALIVFSPAFIWNVERGFAGFAFQGARMTRALPNESYIFQALAGQLLYLTPWLLVPLAISLVNGLRAGREEPRGWFLAVLAVVPVAVFTVGALLVASLPHWPMPGWLLAIPLFGRDAATLALRRPVFARSYIAAAAAVFAILIVAFGIQASRGGLIPSDVVAANPAIDPTTDLIDWRELRDGLNERGLLDSDLVVASPHWTYAGKVSYALGDGVPVLCLCRDQQQFAFRDDWRDWLGRDVLIVAPRHAGERTSAGLGGFFDALEPLPPLAISRGGETVITLDLNLGRNLKIPLEIR